MVNSQRGKRRVEQIEKTGGILKIIGFLLMIIFYIVMLYILIITQFPPTTLIDQVGNSTTSRVSFNLIIKNQISII